VILRAALSLDPDAQLRPITGGDISAAFRVERPGLPDIFAKSHESPPAGMFEAEADGLAALANAADVDGILLVPEVISVGPNHLALEWIGGRPDAGVPGDASERLGRGLARLHRHSSDSFGWHVDNWIGSLPQHNGRVGAEEGAGVFFAEQRLMPQLELAALRGSLPPGTANALEKVCSRLGELIPNEPPALVHGDLWNGNWTEDGKGNPWIYDCAVSYNHRESELAFTRLFGGFPPSFYAAYDEEWPRANGFEARVELWNLYPLLVHANLFGGSYGAQVARIAHRWA